METKLTDGLCWCGGIAQCVSSESEHSEVLQKGCVHILAMTDEGVICFNFHGVN